MSLDSKFIKVVAVSLFPSMSSIGVFEKKLTVAFVALYKVCADEFANE